MYYQYLIYSFSVKYRRVPFTNWTTKKLQEEVTTTGDGTFFHSRTAPAVNLICWQIASEIVALASECGDAQNLHQMTSDDMESFPTLVALMDTDRSWICTTAIHWRVPAMCWNRNRSKSKRAIWSVGGVNVHPLDQGSALRSSENSIWPAESFLASNTINLIGWIGNAEPIHPNGNWNIELQVKWHEATSCATTKGAIMYKIHRTWVAAEARRPQNKKTC